MNLCGSNNPNWKDGISKNNYYYTKRSRERYPEKEPARKALYRAIKSEKLIKPKYCQHPRCKETEIFAHHIDYSEPLAVVWYCRAHHIMKHKLMKSKPEKTDKLKEKTIRHLEQSFRIQEDLFSQIT
jgi:ribosomal protein S27AE